MSFTEENWKHLQSLYAARYNDIINGKNLEAHKQDIEAAIKDLDVIIEKEREGGKPTPTLDGFRNDFYYLLYEIKQRS